MMEATKEFLPDVDYGMVEKYSYLFDDTSLRVDYTDLKGGGAGLNKNSRNHQNAYQPSSKTV